ncbi:hypothetical protein [Vitiosangium sp. GDMCC 1.1324]|uniref:hypothetical protein n=1 Tax=Vitiosangium sp. (strain GDMCC 1.1324) TaxID=2138576 RepID=UPI000D3B3E12|nr:hypothetical protein [Vitiosangium sp. GDMCC 1.1324]PTL75206.1 hypothetical protein DAT35_56090 [Vitiosangium sp. GDMCC 1.1324]
MRLIRASLLLAVLPLLPACEPGDCSATPNGILMVTVVDTRGNPIRDARVTFTPEGESEQPAWCAESAGTGQNCERWTGGDGAGNYLVQATSADGTRTAQQSVSVKETSCGFTSGNVQLTLPD